MTKPKQPLTRAQLEFTLQQAIVKTLSSLEIESTAETFLWTFKALQNISFDMAECAEAPRDEIARRLSKICKRRLPRLSASEPQWVMPEGQA